VKGGGHVPIGLRVHSDRHRRVRVGVRVHRELLLRAHWDPRAGEAADTAATRHSAQAPMKPRSSAPAALGAPSRTGRQIPTKAPGRSRNGSDRSGGYPDVIFAAENLGRSAVAARQRSSRAMLEYLLLLAGLLRTLTRVRGALVAENLLLRQQLAIL